MKKLPLLCTMLLATGLAQGATIANYGMTTAVATGDTSTAPPEAGLTISTLSNTGGFTGGPTNFTGYTLLPGSDPKTDTTSWYFRASDKTAVESGYIEFTLTVDPTYQINDLTVYADMAEGQGSITGHTNWQMTLRSSADGYATNLGSVLSSTGPGGNNSTSHLYVKNNKTTGSIGSQTAGAITYRLYTQDNSGSGAGNKYAILNALRVEGNFSPVPEPSSTALLGLGGLALILRRRK